MRALSRAIDRFCLKHRKFGIPRLMSYVVFASAAVYIIYMLDQSSKVLELLSFNPVRILWLGQVWRIVTWIFLPLSDNPFFVVLALYFYYFVGSSLEREWGTAKFTVFYILGMLLNIIYGVVLWLIIRYPIPIWPNFLNLSMFFAFAVFFPDYVLRLFFVIPIRAKWLGLLNGLYFLYEIVSNLIDGAHFFALLPVVALLNFFIICGDELLSYLRPLKSRANPQALNFKRAARKAKRAQDHLPYRQKCAICGITDVDHPDMEFRYCSRCEGYHCYCIDHINNHLHYQGRSTDL